MLLFVKINLRALVMLIHTLVWATFGIVIMAINPTGRWYFWLAHHVWSKQALFLAGAPLIVKGLENIDSKQSYVVCVNHQSLLDIPILFRVLPFSVRFLAKKSLFYIPVFGWSMYLAGFVPIDRSGGKKARDGLKTAAKKIKNGRSVIVFPEGTRSSDGAIHSFKSGAFILAIESGNPILPVVINGAFELGPKTAVKVYPHSVEVQVGPPIFTQELTVQDRAGLMSQTRDTMVQMRAL